MIWERIGYNISNGKRFTDGIVSSPFKPGDKFPYYLDDKSIKFKWVNVKGAKRFECKIIKD